VPTNVREKPLRFRLGQVLRAPPWDEVPKGPCQFSPKVTGCSSGHEKPGLFTRVKLPWKVFSPGVRPDPGHESPAGDTKE